MKNILTFLLLVIFFYSCGSSTYNRQARTYEPKYDLNAHHFEYGKECFLSEEYRIAIRDFKNISENSQYKDSVKIFLINNLYLSIESDPSTSKEFLSEFNIINYELESKIDSTIAEREKEKIQAEQELLEITQLDLINRASDLLLDIQEDIDYFQNQIDGKSESYIADLLYSEGFGRRYKTEGSNFCTIYGRTQHYQNGDYYDIDIYTWHSYGYGKLFYDIRSSVTLKGYGLIVYENENTKLFDKLIDE